MRTLGVLMRLFSCLGAAGNDAIIGQGNLHVSLIKANAHTALPLHEYSQAESFNSQDSSVG